MSNSSTLKVSEIFLSIQGEGPYTGHPMVFVRLFGCNFTCPGFSNPTLEKIDTKKDSDQLTTIGCDSLYSWHSDFKSAVRSYTVSELLTAIKDVLPNKKWVSSTGRKPILCFTGGEPTLQQKSLSEFFDFLDQARVDIEHILIETNCAVELQEQFIHSLEDWLDYSDRKITWACSPKLSNSGESHIHAIKPKVFKQQQLSKVHTEQYLKFVSDGSAKSFDEIKYVSELFALVSFSKVDSYVMSEGATREQQEKLQVIVAKKCIEKGYIFCPRVHVWLWDNTKGS